MLAQLAWPLAVVSGAYVVFHLIGAASSGPNTGDGSLLPAASLLQRCHEAGEACTHWCLHREGFRGTALATAAAACENAAGNADLSPAAVFFLLFIGLIEIVLHTWAARHLCAQWRASGGCCACTGAFSGKTVAGVAAMASKPTTALDAAAVATPDGAATSVATSLSPPGSPVLGVGAPPALRSADKAVAPSMLSCSCCPFGSGVRANGDVHRGLTAGVCCCEAAYGQLERKTRSLENQLSVEATSRTEAQREARRLTKALEESSEKLVAMERTSTARTERLSKEAALRLKEADGQVEFLRTELERVRRDSAFEMRRAEERATASLRAAESLAGATERCVFQLAGESLPALTAGSAKREAGRLREDLSCSITGTRIHELTESWSSRGGSSLTNGQTCLPDAQATPPSAGRRLDSPEMLGRPPRLGTAPPTPAIAPRGVTAMPHATSRVVAALPTEPVVSTALACSTCDRPSCLSS